MKELEFKHIAPYLPYGLKVNNSHGNPVEVRGLIDLKYIEYFCDKTNLASQDEISKTKTLLRPMSDLFENIVHNGEIVCVAKLIADKQPNLCFTSDENGNYIWNDVLDEELDFTSEPQDLPHWITETLNEYHFDWRYDLILKTLAEPIKNK